MTPKSNKADKEGGRENSPALIDIGGYVYMLYEDHLRLSERMVRQARAEAFEEAAGILRDESEGDIDYALFLLKELSNPSSEASIKRLKKTIAEQLERAARAARAGEGNEPVTAQNCNNPDEK